MTGKLWPQNCPKDALRSRYGRGMYSQATPGLLNACVMSCIMHTEATVRC